MRELLKTKRIALNYNQAEMAEKLGISRPHYCKIEIGQRTPPLVLAIKIKKVVDYYDDDLFDNED